MRTTPKAYAAIVLSLLATACTSIVGLTDLPVLDGGGTDGTAGDSGPAVDAAPGKDAGGDATSGEAGPCVPGASCTPSNQCDLGTTDCSTGFAVCQDEGPSSKANGASCGTGEVCNGGQCTACAANVPCTLSKPCSLGATSCATGTSVCMATGPAVNGTSCGSGMLCESGACITCSEGAACSPAGKPCDSGSITCSSGSPVCTDTGGPAANGTPCGTGNVCESGQCTTCQQGGSCQPSNPCHEGTLVCTAGNASCTDTGTAVANGTSCGNDLDCQSGACCSSIEICDNGKDDNCDGLVDCADPYCTTSPGGWACTSLPTGGGWTIGAYEANARPSCPPNFTGMVTDVVSGISASPATCGCTCGLQSSAACVGMWNWSEGTTSGCTAVKPGGLNLTEGSCVDNQGDNLLQSVYWTGAVTGAVSTRAGSCSASPTTSKPAVTSQSGETCALPATGGGCASGQVCAPTQPTGFQLCAYNTSGIACPSGTTTNNVDTGYTDTRGCGACSCGTEDLSCSMTGLDFFTNTGCTGNSCEITTGCAKCNLNNGTGDTNSLKPVFTTNGQESTCVVTAGSTAQGTVSATGPITVCCAP